MLIPKFLIAQRLGSCSKLIFTEQTGDYSVNNPGGYGSPNITKSQVSFVKLKIKTPTGNKYEIKSSYNPSQPNWIIDSSDFIEKVSKAPVNNCRDCDYSYPSFMPNQLQYRQDCEKPKGKSSDFSYKDGCYEITFEVYSVYGVPNFQCSYELITSICDSMVVEALVDGSWRDITNIGITVGENYRFIVLNTIEEYSEWRIISFGKTVDSGKFKRFNCNPVSYSERQTPALVAAKTITTPLTCNLEESLSKMALSSIVDSDLTKKNIAAMALMKLTLIKDLGIGNCNCDCVDESIHTISNIIGEKC